jgi:uncharacterized membrane protein
MNRRPILTILMAVAGVILLLPGVCAVGFIVASGLRNPNLVIFTIWAISFLIALGGVALLRQAFQKPPSPGHDGDQPTLS